MSDNLKQKTVNGILWSSIEKLSVQSVNFVLGLIIARLLSPDDYGVMAMLAIFLAISNAFIDSGFSTALVRKTDRSETDNATAFYFNIGVGIITLVVFYISAPWIALFYNTPILEPISKVVGIMPFLSSLCVVQQALLTSRIDFKTQSKVSLYATIVSGLIGAGMAYYDYGVWALVAQMVSASFVRALMLWILVRWKPIKPFSKIAFIELFSFGSKMLGSSLVVTISQNISTIIIGKTFKPADLGFYSRANQIAQYPSGNLISIIQRVTFPVLSALQNEHERLRESYQKIVQLTAYITFPVMVAIAALADPLIHLILTDKWEKAIIPLQIFCIALVWWPIFSLTVNAIAVKGKSSVILHLEIIKLLLNLLVLYITIPFGLHAVCWGQVVVSVICIFIYSSFAKKVIQISIFSQLRILIPIIIQSAIMGGLTYLSIQFSTNHFARLGIGTIVAMSSYFLMSTIFHSNSYQTIIEIIRARKGAKHV